MVMVFTELQVQYHDNMKRVFWLMGFVLALQACNDNARSIWVNLSGGDVVTKGGITYMNGKAFTGNVYSVYSNGDTAFIGTYEDGKKKGVFTEWYPNGAQKTLTHYKNGRKNGMYKGWYADGKPKFECAYKDDIYNGNVKEWFPDGQLYKDFNYVNGQEEGMQKMYWDNGKPRANYQSKNGRKYGLTGIKNCSTPWGDSVQRLFDAGSLQ